MKSGVYTNNLTIVEVVIPCCKSLAQQSVPAWALGADPLPAISK